MAVEVRNAALRVTSSFAGRRWELAGDGGEAAREITRCAGISPVLAQLLAARGVASDEVSDYLNPTLKRLLPDPRILKDLDRAMERAVGAVTSREPIAVFGDYDVDGSCSAALLLEFLAHIGQPSRLYIPDRLREGYGPNAPALLALKADGVGLVFTVDCGAGAHAALAEARAANLDVVVLDHHAAPDPVPAFAHVNPNQSGDESGLTHLCAAAVTFLFVVALNRELRERGWYTANGVTEPDLRSSLDLVGLATVCDVVPLKGVNRAFVRAAEARLSSLARPGVRALASTAKAETPFTSYHCGFVFGPRINAGGRVGSATLGAELLLAQSLEVAEPLAKRLDLHNRERQGIEAGILTEAILMAEQQENAPFVLVAGDGWHAGVAGIVASRLKDRFKKPSLVVGFEKENGKGSARSVAGIDVGAMLRLAHAARILSSGGGHAMAAGFALDRGRLEHFRDFLFAQFAAGSAAVGPGSTLKIDALLSPSGATAALADEIARAGPFGAGNEQPVLAVCDARLAFADLVGQGHVRLRLEGADGSKLSGIAFRAAGTPLGEALLAARGQQIHVAGSLRAELWNGRRQVQLHVEDAATVI